jgi:hypothetical protein
MIGGFAPLQRFEQRWACSDTVIDECVAQDKESVRMGWIRIDFCYEAADGSKGRRLSHLLCLWSGRFVAFLIESQI